jgi:hypothetical protein
VRKEDCSAEALGKWHSGFRVGATAQAALAAAAVTEENAEDGLGGYETGGF